VNSAAPPGPLEEVVVVEEEFVTGRGSATVGWFVPLNDGVVRAHRHPSARVDVLERGPGIVWRRKVTLALGRGAVLTRIESRPRAEARDAFEHLTGGSRGPARRAVRTSYRVDAGGRLTPLGPA
jgi:hypothetical protein